MVLKIFRVAVSAVVAAATLVLVSCTTGESPTGQSSQLVINSSLKQLGLGNNVATVRLVVEGESISETFTNEVGFEDGVVTFEVEVPTGEELTFTMTAIDIEGTALFEGSEVATVEFGAVATVDIFMEPVVPMIRVTPRFVQVGGTQEVGQVDVNIHNVDNLFGVSFRIEFDSSVVQVGDVTAGSIFDPDQTIFFSRHEGDYVAVSHTLQGTQSPQGVDGGGTVAIFNLLPGSSLGSTELVINPETVRLIDWEGNELPATGRLYIENGEVEVIEQ